MAHIKCRYSQCYCTINNPYLENQDDCDGEYYNADWCKLFKKEPATFETFENENGELIRIQTTDFCCIHQGIKYIEFEKTVRKYEYRTVHPNTLIIGKEQIDLDCVEYLEIDGRQLIPKEG